MPFLKKLFTGAKSYALAQLTVGIQLGIAITYAVVYLEMSYPVALAIVMPVGIPLVILQSVIANRWLSNKADVDLPPMRPMAIISGESYGWQGFSPFIKASAVVFAFACATTLAVGVGVTTLIVSTSDISLLTDPQRGLPAWLIGASSYIQFLIMISTAAVFVAFTRREQMGSLVERIKSGFGLRDASLSMLLIALIGGLTIGWFPGWLAARIRDLYPSINLGAVGQIDDAILSAGPINAVVLIAVIAVIGPLAEELVFRGYIWSRLRAALPAWAVVVATSLLFAAAHLDPAQAIPLVFTGLFLGWLRLQSGSILLPVIAHIANNTLGVVNALSGGHVSMESGPVMGTAAITIILAALAWSIRKDELKARLRSLGLLR
jgi:membrane protease YdiL (CAAX protease family)